LQLAGRKLSTYREMKAVKKCNRVGIRMVNINNAVLQTLVYCFNENSVKKDFLSLFSNSIYLFGFLFRKYWKSTPYNIFKNSI